MREQTTSERAFQSITEDMLNTYIAKNHDYGDSFKKSLDEFGPIAAVVRMGDKMERIKTLVHHHTEPMVSEKIEDTLKDLANYAVMTIIYLQKVNGVKLNLAEEAEEEPVPLAEDRVLHNLTTELTDVLFYPGEYDPTFVEADKSLVTNMNNADIHK